MPFAIAVRAAARIKEFIPGASPPDVRIAIFLICAILITFILIYFCFFVDVP
jgi:hypothetical protein